MTVNGTAVLAGLCALAAVASACLAVALARGWTPNTGAGKGRRPGRAQRALEQLPAAWRERYRPLLAAGFVAGLLVFILTGWPVHGLITWAAIAALPFVLHPGGSPTARIEALEALAEWLHQMAGLRVADLALEQTIIASARSAPEKVREPVRRLAGRLEANWPAREAYQALADELEDGVADHVVLLLQSHAQVRGKGLADALNHLAASLGRQTRDLREVEADRAKVRASARWISLFVLGVVGVLMINRSYMAPYGTSAGQLLLAALGALFGAVLLWMQRMARPKPQPRLLVPAAARAARPAAAVGDGPGRARTTAAGGAV